MIGRQWIIMTKFQKREISLALSAWRKKLDDRMKLVRERMLEEKGTQDRMGY